MSISIQELVSAGQEQGAESELMADARFRDTLQVWNILARCPIPV
ncbi:hypothetical protein ACTXJX_18430 [Glutamicibacter ardleyensis]